jgi:hypothetical protein
MLIDELYPSKYLRCSDLNGQPMRVTIANLTRENIGGEAKVVMAFTNGTKSLIVNKTNAKAIAKVLNEPDTRGWRGKDIILVPAQVDFRGDLVDAVRVRAAPPLQQPSTEPPSKAPDPDDAVEI